MNVSAGATRPCVDPECPGEMESVQEDDLRYLECDTCGYESAWARVEQAGDVCAAGLTADARASAAGGLVAPPPPPVSLGMTIPRRPGL